MTLSQVVVSTPRYVLMDGSRRIGPEAEPLCLGNQCLPIYGFSGKALYDKFLSQSELALTPYPLVGGYLRNQIESAGDSLMLVAIDPAGIQEPYLQAATMAAVLEAQKTNAMHVTANYRLVFDQLADAYRVEEASKSSKGSTGRAGGFQVRAHRARLFNSNELQNQQQKTQTAEPNISDHVQRTWFYLR